MKSAPCIVGRTLYAIPFGIFGLMHLANSGPMSDMVLKGWPAAQPMVIVSGLCMIAACISIITGKMAKLSSLLLAVMLGIFIVTIHIPGLIHAQDDMSRMMPMIGLLKDLSLLGGAIVIHKDFEPA